MPYYNLEPVLNFSHVLNAYTDVDHFVEAMLFKNNQPFDFSEADGVTLVADKTTMSEESIDMSLAEQGILRINFRGLATGAYLIPVVVNIDGGTIVFGHIRVFVQDTRRSDEITTFWYYPDTEEEEEEWEGRYGGDGDGDGDDGDDDENDGDGGDGDEDGGTDDDGDDGSPLDPDEGGEGEDTGLDDDEGEDADSRSGGEAEGEDEEDAADGE